MFFDKLRQIEERSQEIARRLADPAVFSQQAEYARLRKEHADSQEIVERFGEYREVLRRMSEAQHVEIKVDDKDIRVDVYRSSGPGGQGVNTTDSAVRITHIPTGLVVTCQDERSQLKNRAKAMRVLKARLLERAQEEQQAAMAADRRSQVGTGERSERIRTYNFREGRVTDHRIGLTLHRLPEILEGDLDDIIDALTAAEQAERLQKVES